MKRILLISLIPLLLCSCKNKDNEKEVYNSFNYGAFLGRSDNDVTGFNKYKYVSVELDEFTNTNIERLTNNGTNFLAYLNAGSLENYRDYYDDYESITFKDYDEWPDERWIDVSNTSWQNFLINTLAKDFKDRKAYGVYLDNIDVYTIAKEDGLNYQAFATGIKNIIKGVSDLGLKVMINGGSEFLDDLDEKDSIFDSIWAYHQEEVFSLILDYDNNKFGKQNKEDKEYYQEVASMMKAKGKEIFLLEYSKDSNLNSDIKKYCESNKYHCYIATDIDLK